jgi:glycine/serine hydroxymethyltransferase
LTDKDWAVRVRAAELLKKLDPSADVSSIRPAPPLKPSGIRVGTPAACTVGMDEDQLTEIASIIGTALKNKDDDDVKKSARGRKPSKHALAAYRLATQGSGRGQ